MRPSFEETLTLTPSHSAYPAGLLQLPGTPFPGKRWIAAPTLYLRGTPPSGRMIAVVGTRYPCSRSKTWTRKLVTALAADGWVIGSGGAHGIDAIVHRAALAARAVTVVVTTGGLDGKPYPEHHGALYRRVLRAGGTLVSLDPDGTVRERREFLVRNHVLAAWASAIIAVELKPDRRFGGTGHTARSAIKLGRPVLTVAHAPWTRGGAGASHLLEQGAIAVASVADVRRALADRAQASFRRSPRIEVSSEGSPTSDADDLPIELGPDERSVIGALGLGGRHIDEICAATGLTASAAGRALLMCALDGAVVEGPPGMFALMRSSYAWGTRT
jgi:DNA processing protein